MPILQEQDRNAIVEKFNEELEQDVTLTFYTNKNLGGLYIPGRECQTCAPTQQLLEELAELSPKLRLEVVDFYANRQEAQSRGIDKIPALVISRNGEHNVRYFGMPSGYEFAVLLESIVAASQRQSGLSPDTLSGLRSLKQDVHIQVFVTPS
ncbi:MAG: thioredoxin family protein [Chloroflexi bacterium]|nr:thioredoxin family protein [Chloroflexota bacterium]